jgi:hypothetical protein
MIYSPHEVSWDLQYMIGDIVGSGSLGCNFQPSPSQNAMHALSPESYEGARERAGLNDA